MNETGEKTGLKEQIFGVAQKLKDRLRRELDGVKAQQQPNPADIAAAEAALGVSAPEATQTLSRLFKDKFPTRTAAQQAVTGIGASINQDRRTTAATEQKMDELNGALGQMMGSGQTQNEGVDDILAEMERRSQAQKGQKP